MHEGHRVIVQSGAGLGSRIDDEAYRAAGAEIVDTAEEAWGQADLLLKVKEPIASEYGFLRDDLTLFTYLHLAADKPLTTALVDAGTTAVAYETVQLPDRSLPLLVPMSEIAGRLSVTMGSYSLLRSNGGRLSAASISSFTPSMAGVSAPTHCRIRCACASVTTRKSACRLARSGITLRFVPPSILPTLNVMP